MLNEFSRTKLILGQAAMEKLEAAHIAIFGLGAAGSMAAEALSRCGVRQFTLFDETIVKQEDLAAQLSAMRSTMGMPKAEAMKNRILEINPKAQVNTCTCPLESVNSLDFKSFDYIIDTIFWDMQQKLRLTLAAHRESVPIISCLDNGITGVTYAVSLIAKATDCAMAQQMKKELGMAGIKKHKIVYAKDPDTSLPMPSNAGMLLAGEAVKDIIG